MVKGGVNSLSSSPLADTHRAKVKTPQLKYPPGKPSKNVRTNVTKIVAHSLQR